MMIVKVFCSQVWDPGILSHKKCRRSAARARDSTCSAVAANGKDQQCAEGPKNGQE